MSNSHGRTTKQNICRIPRQSSPASRQKQISLTAIGGMKLKMSNGNDDNEKGIPFLALALGISILLSTWPLLTFFRDVNGPTDGFDVDMFMTLKDMMGDNESVGSSTTSMLTDENYRSIVELPALSPAEQLVGAVFGPPR